MDDKRQKLDENVRQAIRTQYKTIKNENSEWGREQKDSPEEEK